MNIDSKTRAVIERLVEASKVMDECYCEAGPYLNDRTRAKHRKALIEFRVAIAEARKLLEDDALTQPASEDAWLRKSLQLTANIRDATDDESSAAYFDQLEHHLRTRPAREGFVSVPVDLDDLQWPTKEQNGYRNTIVMLAHNFEETLKEIAGCKNLTATPAQFAAHLQKIAKSALDKATAAKEGAK